MAEAAPGRGVLVFGRGRLGLKLMRIEIIGEDSAHAAIVSQLTLQQIEASALAAGAAADWLVGDTDSLKETPSQVLALEGELLLACERCLGSLERLRVVGAACGLVAFLDAVHGRLAPRLWGAG